MRKILKWLAVLLGACFQLGFIVDAVEKKCGKLGWVESHKPYGFYERNLKRPLDFGLSLFAIIVLWPVMIGVAILVKVKLGSPTLFRQKRPGLGGKVFIIKKYRTMLDGDDPDEKRLTDFGRKLRATSIDELPELFSILTGSMSIVGPRPLLVEYLDRYSPEQTHRHDVRPGLTGLAQVSGRNELSWDEKFEDDVAYVRNISLLGDLKILFKTVATVLGKKGISSKTSETMEAFTGSER